MTGIEGIWVLTSSKQIDWIDFTTKLERRSFIVFSETIIKIY